MVETINGVSVKEYSLDGLKELTIGAEVGWWWLRRWWREIEAQGEGCTPATHTCLTSMENTLSRLQRSTPRAQMQIARCMPLAAEASVFSLSYLYVLEHRYACTNRHVRPFAHARRHTHSLTHSLSLSLTHTCRVPLWWLGRSATGGPSP